jgi:hypothetical protein
VIRRSFLARAFGFLGLAPASAVKPRTVADVLDSGDPELIARTLYDLGTDDSLLGRRVYHRGAEWVGYAIYIPHYSVRVVPREPGVPFASTIPARLRRP